MTKKILLISVVLLICLYLIFSHHIAKEQREQKYAFKQVENFKYSIERYSDDMNASGVAVIYTNLTLMIEELLAPQYISSYNNTYCDFELLEDLKDGEDIYGNKYSYSVNVEKSEVTITCSKQARFMPEDVMKNIQSVAKIPFIHDVEILDTKGDIYPEKIPYQVIDADSWRKDGWKSLEEYKELASYIPEPSLSKKGHTSIDETKHITLYPNMDLYISYEDVLLKNKNESIFHGKPKKNVIFTRWYISENNRFLCILGKNFWFPFESQLVVVDLESRKLLYDIILADIKGASSLCFSRDTKQMYIAGKNGVFCYSTDSGNLIQVIGNGSYLSLCLNSDENELAAGMTLLGQVQIFEIQTGNKTQCFRTGHKYLRNIQYSPDSKYLATWEDGKSDVKIWLADKP